MLMLQHLPNRVGVILHFRRVDAGVGLCGHIRKRLPVFTERLDLAQCFREHVDRCGGL